MINRSACLSQGRGGTPAENTELASYVLDDVEVQGHSGRAHRGASTWATMAIPQDHLSYQRFYACLRTQPQWRFVGAFAKFEHMAHRAVS